jgi:precorrin-6Y C5,15-methyltransferase (decarboxylating)
MKESCLEGLKIFILGCPSNGVEGLSKKGREALDESKMVFISERFYNLLPSNLKRKNKFVKFPEKLSLLPEKIKEAYNNGYKEISILATGDPNFFGITNFIKKYFPESIEKIIPSISIMQEAFAKLKLNWEDAGFFSLHGREKDIVLPFLLTVKKGFLFTSDATQVLSLLNLLKEHRLSDFKIHIFEDIGGKNESLMTLTYPYLIRRKISSLNVVIFEREKDFGEYPGIGIGDDLFEQKKGMITKKEVRVNVISLLRLKEGMILWDVGAGSGSVSIEASFNPRGVLAYAIEKDEISYLNLKKNIEKFGAINVIPIFSDFKDIGDSIPRPDRIFIGGSSGDIRYVLSECFRKVKEGGVIVISLVTLENLNKVINFCKENKIDFEFNSVMPIRGKKVKDNTIFNALNPIYIVRIIK